MGCWVKKRKTSIGEVLFDCVTVNQSWKHWGSRTLDGLEGISGIYLATIFPVNLGGTQGHHDVFSKAAYVPIRLLWLSQGKLSSWLSLQTLKLVYPQINTSLEHLSHN